LNQIVNILHQLTEYEIFKNISFSMNTSVIVTIIVQSVLFLGTVIKIHNDVQMKLKELDIRLSAVEKQDDEIYQKLDKMMDLIQEIKIQLERKQNRD